ncbi:MAG: gamma-glutamyl-gamma-aminobutyrate hydrolase family protein [Thermoanaerobaculia bacterium]
MKPVVVCAESTSHAVPYAGALRATGIRAESIRLVTPDDPIDGLRALGAEAAGVLLCGGPDIEPARYGQTARAEAGLTVMPELDAREWELLAGAHDARTPLLGVCRGMQVLNVFLGGTLYQDVKLELPGVTEHYIRTAPDFLAHDVEVLQPHLPLGELLSRERPRTNSRHHQAVRDLGRDLLPVAYSPDGLLEVMQLPPGGWWVWAVQWHPENLLQHEQQREIWLAFVRQVERRSHATGERRLALAGS